MKRALVTIGIVFVLVGFARPVHAQGDVTGGVLGIELCPQSICGAAVFYGAVHFKGTEVDSAGTIAGAIQHDTLPDPGGFAALTGGGLQIQIGPVVTTAALLGGWLYNNGDNTFSVAALFLSEGGFLVFEGTLNHNFFPPLIYGTLYPIGFPD